MNIRQNRNILIAAAGAILSAIGFVASENSEGFNGLAYAPLAYGGIIILLFGLIRAFFQYRHSHSPIRIITAILLTILIGYMITVMVISKISEHRADYCRGQYPQYSYSPDSIRDKFNACMNHKIN